MPAKSAKRLIDIYWVAALIDGEGSFHVNKNGTSPNIKLAMVDLDLICRFQNITNSNGIRESKLDSGKMFYTTLITGNDAIGWMMTIYSIMSKRRKNKIKEILNLWSKFKTKEIRTICKRRHIVSGYNAIKDNKGYFACRMCRNFKERERDKRNRLNACA